jgi:NAD(P)-dependent dehydrogenase (short-subunit alcohol dehydrogenase family)
MNVKDLGNRVVLITSAGSGIERQTALLRAAGGIGRQHALPCARPAPAPAAERGNGHA